MCALPCPVFRQSRDLTLTLHGRARALLAGATPAEVAPSTLACVLCGACEPVCPEEIDTVGMTLELRRTLTTQDMNPLARTVQTQHPSWVAPPAVTGASAPPARTFALLASSRFEARTDLQTRVIETLGGHAEVNVIPDVGDDLAVRLEAGLDIPDTRRR